MVTYTIGCFTKHWNVFWVLFTGRLFCGVATSLLYSAFESWLVAEHFKASQAWLVATQQSFFCWLCLIITLCCCCSYVAYLVAQQLLIPCLCCVMLYSIVGVVFCSVCEMLLW